MVFADDMGCSDCRMSSKRHLRRGRENPHIEASIGLHAREDKGNLGKIHFPGDFLHIAFRQIHFSDKYSQLIALILCLRETIDYEKVSLFPS